MKRRDVKLVRWLPLAWLLLVASGAAAQDAAPDRVEGAPDLPAVELVTRRAEEAMASPDLDAATRAALVELYRKTINSLEAIAEQRRASARFENAIEGAAAEAVSLREQLLEAKAESTGPEADFSDLTLAEIEQRLLNQQAHLAVAETRLAELEAQLLQQRERPGAIRLRLADAKGSMPAMASDVPPREPGDERPELVLARQWANVSLREQLRSEIRMLEQELLSQPARLERMMAQRDLAEFNRDTLALQAESLEQAAGKRRLEEAEVARSEALAIEREAAGKHPLVADLASRNARLTEEVDRLVNAIDEVERIESTANSESRRIEDTYAMTRQKLEIAGLSHILGQVLQDQQRSLPDAAEFRRQARARDRRIADTSLAQIQLEDERRRLRDLEGYVGELVQDLPADTAEGIRDQLGALALSRAGLIDRALGVQRSYLVAMAEADIAQRRLQEAVERFDAFLDSRLLWVRSAEMVSVDSIARIPSEVAVWADPERWLQALSAFVREVLVSPLVLVALLVVAWREVRRSRLLRALRDCGGNVGRLLADQFGDTLRAFGLIGLLALPWPFLMFAAGRQLIVADGGGDFGKDLGAVLVTLAPVLLQLMALRLFVAPGSIAEVHFGWRSEGVRRLYRDLVWFSPLLMGLAFVTMLTLLPRDLGPGTGLGRVLFLVLMAAFTVFFWRLSRPNGGTISILSAAKPAGRVYRLRHLWFLLLVGPPIVAAVISVAGYTYTASTMIDRILRSAWLAMGLIVLHQLIERWLTLNQGRLRLEAARARLSADRESRQDREGQDASEISPARDAEEPVVDIESLDATSRKLLNNAFVLLGALGLWTIWNDVFPALVILEYVTLWTHTSAGAEAPVAVTLSSLLRALLVLVVTVVAVRQLPSFLEFVLMRWLRLSPGDRYTVVTLTRYTVVAVGVIWIFGFLGGDWSQIQWIVAALGVGIGFGLQEIVANFISGLIILFERPIRIGDVVTVGNTDGVVTRIQIRATTIRNWDRKELLVPNKNFITQELLNWSLSDQTTRILLRVGIAYGSDVEKAMQIMERAAAEHPNILADPAPFVVFEEFGDNALLLSLRCFIGEIDYRLRTISDINLAIDKGMSMAGVEIAFPQRDVHLDTKQPLAIRLFRDAGMPDS
jgi:potassium efflux system protein